MIQTVSVPSPLRGKLVVELELTLVLVPLPNFGFSPRKSGTESVQSLWMSIVIGTIVVSFGDAVAVGAAVAAGAFESATTELVGGIGCGFEGETAFGSCGGTHANAKTETRTLAKTVRRRMRATLAGALAHFDRRELVEQIGQLFFFFVDDVLDRDAQLRISDGGGRCAKTRA